MTCFIVDRLMAFDREDRFSSYPELMDAVAQAQEEYARAMQESGLTWAERRAVEARRARRRKCRIIVASSIASVVALALGVWGWTKWREEGAPAPATSPSPISPAAEAALEDRGAAESRLERSIRFGKLFNEAQESLNRGDLVKAAAMFGDLAAQPDCPLSTSLWAGLNQVLCMWVRGQFPEGVERLEELGRKMEACGDPEELERSRDIGNLVMYLSSADWSSRMPGLRSNSDLAVHYYVGMALKSWYFAGRWTEYGGFLDRVAADAADDRDRNVRELASAWLSNLERYTDQYARLKRLQDMPEKTVAEVEAKRSAADFLRGQMVSGEVPSMSPAYAALEGILDHLRMQYQVARDWEAAEAVKASERKKAEERQKKLEEEKRREILLAAQSRSYEDVCREGEGIMKETGDYEKVSTVYGEAEKVISSPAESPPGHAPGNDGPDASVVLPHGETFARTAGKETGENSGAQRWLQGAPERNEGASADRRASGQPGRKRCVPGQLERAYVQLPACSGAGMPPEAACGIFFPGGYVFQAFAYFWQADGNHFRRTAGKSIASDGPLFH